MSLAPPEGYRALPLPDRADLSPAQSLENARAFENHMGKRHTVRDFSDQPVARAVIESCIRTAGTAPSGANHQPWHFAAIANADLKQQIRAEAEVEERAFYAGGGGDAWIKALEPIGTNAEKPHLTIAPWLIVVFGERWSETAEGTRRKNYYVPESVNIATGFLLAALHHAGLCTLTHTPNPMAFLNTALARPRGEKPTMIIAVGHPAPDATVPAVAKIKKPLHQISSFFD